MTNQMDSRKIEIALARLGELEALIAESKKLYAERDLLTLQLRSMNFEYATQNGIEYRMVDNFSGEKNVCYRAAFVRRFEVTIKEIKP